MKTNRDDNDEQIAINLRYLTKTDPYLIAENFAKFGPDTVKAMEDLFEKHKQIKGQVFQTAEEKANDGKRRDLSRNKAKGKKFTFMNDLEKRLKKMFLMTNEKLSLGTFTLLESIAGMSRYFILKSN